MGNEVEHVWHEGVMGVCGRLGARGVWQERKEADWRQQRPTNKGVFHLLLPALPGEGILM
jgi:hypothetical protein